MPTIAVSWDVLSQLAPMTALDNVQVQDMKGALRFVWDEPPAAEGVTHILARVWPSGGTRPATPTADLGTGTPLTGIRRYGDVVGLAAGMDSWELTPGRDE